MRLLILPIGLAVCVGFGALGYLWFGVFEWTTPAGEVSFAAVGMAYLLSWVWLLPRLPMNKKQVRTPTPAQQEFPCGHANAGREHDGSRLSDPRMRYNSVMLRLAVALTLTLLAGSVRAADWGPLQYLIGEWTGEGDGSPGKGTGGFSFSEDLQGKILVRRNVAEYPASDGKPAFRHDDLMVVYRDDDGKRQRAIYFDSEGHTIAYLVESRGESIVFTSEGSREAMRYRFTYTRSGTSAVKIKFEIGPPGKDLAVYIEAIARKKN